MMIHVGPPTCPFIGVGGFPYGQSGGCSWTGYTGKSSMGLCSAAVGSRGPHWPTLCTLLCIGFHPHGLGLGLDAHEGVVTIFPMGGIVAGL